MMKRPLILFLCLSLLSACGGEEPMVALPANAIILAFGDSLTAGNGAPDESSYPAQLARLIDRTVINAGISGEESGAGRARLEALLDEHRPQLLILCHGGNDLLRKRPMAQLAENLRAMITMAQSRGIEVIMLGVPAPGIFLSSEVIYANVAEATGVIFIEDVISEVLSEPSKKSDTVHPNAAGYSDMASAIAEELRDRGAI